MGKHLHSVYVGIDVHRTLHRVAVVPASLYSSSASEWKHVVCFDIGNSAADFNRLDVAIREYASCPDEAAIAVDITGHYSEPLVYYLLNRGYRPCHLLAKATRVVRQRLFGEQSKTDTIDASGLAYLLYLRDIHGLSFGVSSTSPELGSKAAVLRCLTLQKLQYDKLYTQFTNRIYQFSHAVFPEGSVLPRKTLLRILRSYPTPEDILTGGLKDIKYLGTRRQSILTLASNTVGVPCKDYRQLILDLCKQRDDAQVKRNAILRRIEDEVEEHPYGHILLSFPQMGAAGAAAIIGVIGDIAKWPDKRKLKKALGVYGITIQSGMAQGKTKKGNEGSRPGRRALFLVVFGSIRQNAGISDFRDYYVRQVARGKPKMKALFATMGKLAEIVYHCLKTGERYQYQGRYHR